MFICAAPKGPGASGKLPPGLPARVAPAGAKFPPAGQAEPPFSHSHDVYMWARRFPKGIAQMRLPQQFVGPKGPGASGKPRVASAGAKSSPAGQAEPPFSHSHDVYMCGPRRAPGRAESPGSPPQRRNPPPAGQAEPPASRLRTGGRYFLPGESNQRLPALRRWITLRGACPPTPPGAPPCSWGWNRVRCLAFVLHRPRCVGRRGLYEGAGLL